MGERPTTYSAAGRFLYISWQKPIFDQIIAVYMVLSQELTETLRHFFAQQPVSRAYIFGSLARGEASDQSDVDVLVELDKGATLFDHARMSWQLEDLLQHKVDVVTESGLSPYLRPFINRDRILVYER